MCGSCRTAQRLAHERADDEEEELEEDGPQRPDHAWFVKQRMSSGYPIPSRARERGLAGRQRRSPGLTASEAPGTWVFAGPSNVGGRLTALAVDPLNVNHLWAGAACGGVFESTDA